MHLVAKSGAKILPDRRNPAAKPDVLAVGCMPCALKRGVNPIGDKVKRRAAAHGERGTWVIGEHEDRTVIGRIVTPPSFPVLVGPRPAHRSEHIASHNPRADVAETARRKFVVGSGRAAVSAMHLLKSTSGERPFVQRAAAYAEGIVKVLVGSGTIAVKRHRKSVHAKFRHEISSDLSLIANRAIRAENSVYCLIRCAEIRCAGRTCAPEARSRDRRRRRWQVPQCPSKGRQHRPETGLSR